MSTKNTILKKNQELVLEITDVNNLGFGVGHVDRVTVFVRDAVDGDRVEVRIILVKPDYAVGKILRIVDPSPYRTEPVCHVKGCGGCAYQSLTYDHELELKRNYVRWAFNRVGLKDVQVDPVQTVKDKAGNPVVFGYRNKAQYPVSKDAEGNIVIGFYSAKSHRVVEAADCPLQNPSFRPILETLRTFIHDHGISVYDEQSGEGLIRHIYLRKAVMTNEISLTLVINGESLPCQQDFIDLLNRKHPEVVCAYLNVNTDKTNVICSDRYELLFGKKDIEDILCGKRLRITPSSFYQVNHDAAELLYQIAAQSADFKGTERLLDLFCGIGSIGLSMSDHIQSLTGVEIVDEAVQCASSNAKINGISNANYYCIDADRIEEMSQTVIDSADVVVLDPPRKGCSEGLISFLSDAPIKKIIYISCNPETLARDVKAFQKDGFAFDKVIPVDLFPRTGHVETVCLMSRVER